MVFGRAEGRRCLAGEMCWRNSVKGVIGQDRMPLPLPLPNALEIAGEHTHRAPFLSRVLLAPRWNLIFVINENFLVIFRVALPR